MWAGIYWTIACIWGVVWGIAALSAWITWEEMRAATNRGDKARKHRQTFLARLLEMVMAPAWPVPVAYFGYRFFKGMFKAIRQAMSEEMAEALERKNAKVQDK